MRSRAGLLLLLIIPLMTCCATRDYENMRARAEHAEHELERAQHYIAGVQDDNAKLQAELIQWEGGMMLMARDQAEMRKGCDL